MSLSLRRTLLYAALIITAGAALGAGFAMRPSFREGVSMSRYVITTAMRSPYDARNLLNWLNQNGFDVAGFNWQKGQIEVITDDSGVQRLKAQGLTGFVQDRRTMGAQINAVDPQYLNPEKVEAQLKALNAQFPDLTRLEQIGVSREGRAIWALLISSTPDRRDARSLEKPSVIFDGMHHAREVMTSEIVMDIGVTLLGAARRRVPAATSYIERWNIWIVPMLNVDGNNMVWTRDTWWRKNALAEQGRVYGVDINRNYPYGWNGCRGSSGSRTAQDYRGAAGASEPETQALMRLGQLARPAASMSYHSYGELVLYPFGCNGRFSGESALIDRIGKELAAVLPSENGRGTYTPGTAWQVLYSVDGDSMSYMHAEFGALAYTLEVNQEFQPPYAKREPTLQKQRVGWQFFLHRLEKNMLAIKVIDGRTNAPALAQIEINTIAHKFGEKGFQTNQGGNFFKVLDPGSYQLRITLADGRSTTTGIDMNGAPQAHRVIVP